MKNALTFAILLVVLASSAASAQPPNSYIWVFFDSEHGQYCIRPPGSLFTPVECWIWCLPSMSGVIAADFSVEYPSSVLPATVVLNPGLSLCSEQSLDYCNPPYYFSSCRIEWTWVFHQMLFILSFDPSTVWIVANPATSQLAVSTCASGNPVESCIAVHGYLNWVDFCPGDAVEQSTWGSIKSLYR